MSKDHKHATMSLTVKVQLAEPVSAPGTPLCALITFSHTPSGDDGAGEPATVEWATAQVE